LLVLLASNHLGFSYVRTGRSCKAKCYLSK